MNLQEEYHLIRFIIFIFYYKFLSIIFFNLIIFYFQCLTHPYFLSTLYPPTEPVDLPLPSGLAGQSNGIDSDDELNINYTQNETNTKKRMLEYQQKLEQKRRDRAAGNIVKKLKIEDR